jgi:hypothetical protein
MTDDCWVENVGPLITALEELGIDPVAWAKDPDFSVFNRERDERGLEGGEGYMSEIDFAAGYLQATGNLTGRTWAEQMEDYRKDWEE